MGTNTIPLFMCNYVLFRLPEWEWEKGAELKLKLLVSCCLLNWRRRRMAGRFCIICYSVLNVSIMLLHWYGKLRVGYKMLVKITVLEAV